MYSQNTSFVIERVLRRKKHKNHAIVMDRSKNKFPVLLHGVGWELCKFSNCFIAFSNGGFTRNFSKISWNFGDVTLKQPSHIPNRRIRQLFLLIYEIWMTNLVLFSQSLHKKAVRLGWGNFLWKTGRKSDIRSLSFPFRLWHLDVIVLKTRKT